MTTIVYYNIEIDNIGYLFETGFDSYRKAWDYWDKHIVKCSICRKRSMKIIRVTQTTEELQVGKYIGVPDEKRND